MSVIETLKEGLKRGYKIVVRPPGHAAGSQDDQ